MEREEKNQFLSKTRFLDFHFFEEPVFELILDLIEYLVRKWFELHELLNLYF